MSNTKDVRVSNILANTYLKVTIEKNWRYQKVDFLSLINLSPGRFLGSSNSSKNFYYFNFERNYDALKSKSSYILLNKNINFDKNETESKMKYPKRSFTETNLLLQLIQELQNKSKAVVSWSSLKKKRAFLYRLFCPEKIFLTLCLSQCIVYWIHFQNIQYFYISKNITSYTFLLVVKIVERFSLT